MENVFKKYLVSNGYKEFDLKAVLFDMDGVLYDSMKYHAKAWKQIMDELSIASDPVEFYEYEGMTGGEIIDALIEREFGRKATEEEKTEIYNSKADLFNAYNKKERMPGAYDVLKKVKSAGLKRVVVTGSGQKTLTESLEEDFPGVFSKELMVTAYDVNRGKPDPEPYLMGLKKAGHLKPNQAIVVENAPMGVESAVAAGIFTIAVNTGPLDEKSLADAGANIILPSMSDLADRINTILAEIKNANR